MNGPPPWLRWARLCAAQLIIISTLAAFAPAVEGEFIGWDDWPVLRDNPHYRGFSPSHLRWMFTTTHAGHYQPITWMSYAVDHLLWGMDPAGYHLTNTVLHAANAVLVYVLALVLLGVAWRGELPGRWRARELTALLAALLFAVHPLRVESVAWVTERRDVLSAFFLLLTVLAWLGSAMRPQRRFALLALAFGLYVLAMLSKVGGAPLPFVLLVLDWYPLRRIGPGHWWGAHARSVWLEKVPFLAVAVLLSAGVVAIQVGTYTITLEQHGVLARAAVICYGLVFYACKTVVPMGLLPVYELPRPVDPTQLRFVAAAIAVAVVVVGAALLLWRRRIPGAIAALLAYALMLGPVLGFFQNGPQLVADRYSYLSCVGLTLLIASGPALLLRRVPSRALAATFAAVAVAAVVTLGALTWRQCLIWRTTESFWGHMVREAPGSSVASNGWGWVLRSRGRLAEAIPLFERAIEINPNNADPWMNLFSIHEAEGDDEALRDLAERALEQCDLQRVRAKAEEALDR